MKELRTMTDSQLEKRLAALDEAMSWNRDEYWKINEKQKTIRDELRRRANAAYERHEAKIAGEVRP